MHTAHHGDRLKIKRKEIEEMRSDEKKTNTYMHHNNISQSKAKHSKANTPHYVHNIFPYQLGSFFINILFSIVIYNQFLYANKFIRKPDFCVCNLLVCVFFLYTHGSLPLTLTQCSVSCANKWVLWKTNNHSKENKNFGSVDFFYPTKKKFHVFWL